ncbi:fumarylacetoacetate hydrolase family protein [Marivibrio halodurans]|uniref:Fumarylacetoacetate hydrolase family protein n=1 Tax=Marivibrio halodurans TaxID=2039722 RepID=A0A8J7V208_9PROT|nr:fumarylacetoacetate hydrolase family protein [Marivibrio halodurans]MBP5858346.1 fumarylacetoacetate hydrolase family protein [Marivibrio halodurans]
MRYILFERLEGRDSAPALGRIATGASEIEVFDLPAVEAARGVLALIDREHAGDPAPLSGERVMIDAVRPLAPVPRPARNIFCVGKNYFDHAEEFAGSGFDSSAAQGAVPKAPIVFSKLPECVTPFDAPIPVDADITTAIDYEAELAVIIGKGGRGIAKAEALGHVWGYTIVNDVTARDLQGKHSQWLIGKSQDGFCPMGPVALAADAFDLETARIRCWVNDELRQDATMQQLIFDIPTLIETISRGITLMPGDVIATGTPAGVGIGFKPPKYLAPGDSVRIEVDGIGVLENPVVAYRAAENAA